MKLGVVGAGNMGGAIIKGYAKVAEEPVYFHEHFEAKTAEIIRETGAIPTESLAELVVNSDVIIVALKPNMFDDFMPELAQSLAACRPAQEKIIVSIAAGISLAYLERALGADAKIIRAMPNTPAMVSEGMTALAANDAAKGQGLAAALSIFEAFGRAVSVDENLMDAVVGISGSSPAYAYLYLQALTEAGVRHGLDKETARLLAAQSALGAATMVMKNPDISIEQLRINVCSPGGATFEAVKVLEQEGFAEIVAKAMDASTAKSQAMTK